MIEKPPKDILLITTFDTKEEVALYIKGLLEEQTLCRIPFSWQTGSTRRTVPVWLWSMVNSFHLTDYARANLESNCTVGWMEGG